MVLNGTESVLDNTVQERRRKKRFDLSVDDDTEFRSFTTHDVSVNNKVFLLWNITFSNNNNNNNNWGGCVRPPQDYVINYILDSGGFTGTSSAIFFSSSLFLFSFLIIPIIQLHHNRIINTTFFITKRSNEREIEDLHKVSVLWKIKS